MNKILIGFCHGALLSACGGEITHSSQKSQHIPVEDILEETVEEIETVQFVDFSQRGPFSVTVGDHTANVTNCPNMSYQIYTPNDANPPVVILGHGFARGPSVMAGWAEHLASWGVEVLHPSLCHYNVFNGVDHEMNGRNMNELVMIHGTADVVYAGHSAGGLAAIIAAAIAIYISVALYQN